MLIRDIMRSPAVTIPVSTTLQDAYRTMRDRDIRHLPVLDGGKPVTGKLVGDPALIKQYTSGGGTGVTTTTAAPAS